IYKILHAHSSSVQRLSSLAKYSIDLSYFNPDSAMLLAKRCLLVSVKTGNDTAIADCSLAVGWGYYTLSKRDSAEYYLLKAQSLYRKIKAPFEEANSLVDLSYVYQDG